MAGTSSDVASASLDPERRVTVCLVAQWNR